LRSDVEKTQLSNDRQQRVFRLSNTAERKNMNVRAEIRKGISKKKFRREESMEERRTQTRKNLYETTRGRKGDESDPSSPREKGGGKRPCLGKKIMIGRGGIRRCLLNIS